MNQRPDSQASNPVPVSAIGKGTGRYSIWWASVLLLVGLIVTVLVACYTKSEVDADAKQEFDLACNEIRSTIVDRLNAHEQILRSGAAFFENSDGVSRKEWRSFTERQKLQQRLPGIQGIGFAQLIPGEQLPQHLQKIRAEGFPDYRIRPEGERETYSSIIYLEPFADRNLRAFGYDMLTEPVRREAMQRARDQDTAALSGKVVLVQETDKDVQAGTLMYVPVYRSGMPYETVAERRAAIVGWVYSPYRMNDLMRGVLGGWDSERNKRIHLEIFDGDKTSPDALLYDSQFAGGNEQVPASALTLQTSVESAGRWWNLRFTQSGNLAAAVDYSKVWFVLFGGMSISLLLFGLTLALWNTQFNARQIAQKLTAEYKRVDNTLRDSESRMRAITDSAQDAILMMDPQGLISYWNPAAESILGYRSEEAIGKHLHNLLTPERYLESHRMAFHEFSRTGCGNAVGKMVELEARRKDGQEISIALSLSAVSHNGAWHAVGTIRDVTDKKRAEEELLQSRAKLEQYAEALQSSNQVLEEYNHLTESATRAKSEFLANMSHEIRTPMTAILGYADIMLEENAGRATCEHVKIIKRNGEHLLALINDILDLSKVEAGKMQIDPVRCSPCELVAEVVSLMRVRATAKHLKLECDLTPPLPETILTDPLRLRQVLVNLVGNAIKFTDQGEVCIAVRLTKESGCPRLRFDVTDTGIGMNEEQVGRLFQAFSQVDNSSARKFGGTGLGLCISKRITKAMGGDIEVHSTPGKGSIFSVTIDPGPLAGVRMIENTQEALLGCPPVAAAATPSTIKLHGRVLLAEDGPDNQRLIAFLLKKAGAEITVAENGQIAYDEALAAIAQGTPFGVILMDMQMPVMDGYTATRQLRQQGYVGPIVALTANAMAEDCQKCLDAGCDDYATKPIDRQKLLATVAHWTAHTTNSSAKESNASV